MRIARWIVRSALQQAVSRVGVLPHPTHSGRHGALLLHFALNGKRSQAAYPRGTIGGMRCLALLLLWACACGRFGFSTDSPPDAPDGVDANASAFHAMVVRGTTVHMMENQDVMLDTPVDPARTVVVAAARVSHIDPGCVYLSAQLLDSTHVQLARTCTATPAAVNWQVIEFDTSATVQRGTAANTLRVDFAQPVDPDHSFVIATVRGGAVTFVNSDFRGPILDSTGLVLPTAGGGAIEWQVVSSPNITVIRGGYPLADVAAQVAIPEVPLERSLLLLDWNMSSTDSGISLTDDLVVGELTAPNQLSLFRGTTGDVAQVAYQIVTFPPGVRVERGTVDFPTGANVVTQPGGPWNRDRAFALLAGKQHSWGMVNVSGGGDPGGVALSYLLDAHQLRFERAILYPAPNQVSARYQVVEFPAAP